MILSTFSSLYPYPCSLTSSSSMLVQYLVTILFGHTRAAVQCMFSSLCPWVYLYHPALGIINTFTLIRGFNNNIIIRAFNVFSLVQHMLSIITRIKEIAVMLKSALCVPFVPFFLPVCYGCPLHYSRRS